MSDPIADLLALERRHEDFPADAEARILQGIERVIVPGSGPDGDGGPPDAGTGGAPGPSAVAQASKIAPWLGRAAYLAVGVVAGAAGHAALAPSSPVPVAVVAPLPSASVVHVEPAPSPSSSVIVGTRVEDLPSRAPPTPSAVRPVVSAPAAGDGRVAQERADLDVARAALGRGRIDACLEGIERHVRTYGEGHFAEEREVLAIQALASAGRKSEAAARARRFQAKYPTSLFGPAVAESLAHD
jgi:hypothetical protein